MSAHSCLQLRIHHMFDKCTAISVLFKKEPLLTPWPCLVMKSFQVLKMLQLLLLNVGAIQRLTKQISAQIGFEQVTSS